MTPDPYQIIMDVKKALSEDIGSGDVSAALLPPILMAEAEIISREPMLVCGIPWVEAVFSEINPEIKLRWQIHEGQWLEKPDLLCKISGSAKDILTAERTGLNFLQTLSATATKTYQMMELLKHTETRLLDTRKTIPGLRYAQKYAVYTGGGVNHRMGLYDAFLIKENHIRACGSITKAVRQARIYRPDLLVEVEVENMAELREALLTRPDRILLDNFTLDALKEAVSLTHNFQGCTLEASGGIGHANIAAVAETGVDYISVGDLTKSLQAIDLSLLIRTIQ